MLLIQLEKENDMENDEMLKMSTSEYTQTDYAVDKSLLGKLTTEVRQARALAEVFRSIQIG
ncbi:MAG TPA: hypothetical protein VF679_13145, partial [Pedobacter sp.]